MKALWIVLGIVAALGLICCGGLFFIGRGAFNTVMNANKEAMAYSEESVKAISANWDAKELESRLDPESKSQFPPDRIKQIMSEGKERLGKLKKAAPFRMTDIDVNKASTPGATTQIELHGLCSFEKGDADVIFKLAKRDEKWSIMNFVVTPRQ